MTAVTKYKTKQRDQILDCLIRNKDHHITAVEIITALKQGGNPVSKATVYRYLDKLVSQGIVRKYFIEEGKSACYQYIAKNEDCGEHYHLKCIECGQLIHVECKYLEELDSHVKFHHAFEVDHSKTVLYGCCSNCANES
jgi:Fur family ferric uptake transcriptional regulator